MLNLKARDPISNLFLEVLDDPSKREIVLYLTCYIQLVRREGNSYVELEKFLSCAYRNFRSARSYWKDILVEMNVFVISDLYGNMYTGKDIYRIEEGNLYLISLRSEYLNLFENLSQKTFRFWNVLSRMTQYRKHASAQDAVIVSALLFNEGIYEELKDYCELCAERYPAERKYFNLICKISEVYCEGKTTLRELRKLLQELQSLGDVYYGLNLLKLRKDLERLIKNFEAGKGLSPLKIEFVKHGRDEGGWFRKLFRKLKGFFKSLFKKGRRQYMFDGYGCIRGLNTRWEIWSWRAGCV